MHSKNVKNSLYVLSRWVGWQLLGFWNKMQRNNQKFCGKSLKEYSEAEKFCFAVKKKLEVAYKNYKLLAQSTSFKEFGTSWNSSKPLRAATPPSINITWAQLHLPKSFFHKYICQNYTCHRLPYVILSIRYTCHKLHNCHNGYTCHNYN